MNLFSVAAFFHLLLFAIVVELCVDIAIILLLLDALSAVAAATAALAK